jgi:DNA polymerase-3 subunit alpha
MTTELTLSPEANAQATSAAPSDPKFVHLRIHSEYSIVDGLVRIDDVIKAAAKDMQPAMAITDLANLFAMVKFYKLPGAKGLSRLPAVMPGLPMKPTVKNHHV